MLAFLLQAFDPLFRLFQRRQFLAFLDLGALAKFFRGRFQLIADAGAQFLDPGACVLGMGLGGGAFFAGGGQGLIRRFGLPVGFRQDGFRQSAGVGGGIARHFHSGDGIQQGAALFGHARRYRFGSSEFAAQLLAAAA